MGHKHWHMWLDRRHIANIINEQSQHQIFTYLLTYYNNLYNVLELLNE